MIIVIPWAGSVQSYVDAGKEIVVQRPLSCPVCDHHRLIFWSGRFRFATDAKRDFRIFIRRVQCRGCEQTHTLLPNLLFRRRISLAELIVEALKLRFLENRGIRAVAKKLDISRSTISRWADKFAGGAQAHYRRLSYLYHTYFPHAPPPGSVKDFPSALLALAGRLFVLQTSETKQGGFKFASWLSSATGGYLLD